MKKKNVYLRLVKAWNAVKSSAIDDNVIGKKRKLITGCGSLHCMAFFDPQTGALLETYLSKGSTGGCNNFMIGLSRMISISARAGIDIYTIVDQLNSTGNCPSYSVRRATRGDTSRGSCCPMTVGNALLEMFDEVQKELHQTHPSPAAIRQSKRRRSGRKLKRRSQPKACSAPSAANP